MQIVKDIKLTVRETEVLYAMAYGMTDIEIAKEFKISKYTVSGHRKKIITKFNAKNSCQSIYLACLSGYIDFNRHA